VKQRVEVLSAVVFVWLLGLNCLSAQCLNYSDSVLHFTKSSSIAFNARDWLRAETGNATIVRAHLSQSIWDYVHWIPLHATVMDETTGMWTWNPDENIRGCRKVIMTREYKELSSYWVCEDTISICFEPETDPRFDSISNNELHVGTGAGSALFTNFDEDLFRKKDWNNPLFYAPGFTSLVAGGKDSASTVHFSGESIWLWRGVDPHESSPGPTRINEATPVTDFDRVWRLDKERLRDSLNHHLYPMYYTNRNNSSRSWGHFVDVDSNQTFNQFTDYPCLLGDEMLFTSYHYKQHPEVKEDELFLPIQVSQYLFVSKQKLLAPVAFMRFEVVNTSFETFDSVYLGMMSEMGTSFWAPPDYMGCDTSLQLFYNYSKDEKGGSVYADSLRNYRPASGMMFLNQHLDQFVPFSKSAGAPCSGFPRDVNDFYYYMQGRNRNGQPYYSDEPMCDGGRNTKKVKRLFPGNPLDTSQGWSMRRSQPNTSTRFGIGTAGPWKLDPFDTLVLDLAIVVGHQKGSTYLQNLSLLFESAKDVQKWYAENGFSCYDRELLDREQVKKTAFEFYPNPAKNLVQIRSASKGVIVLRNAAGEEILRHAIAENQEHPIDLRAYPSGFYTLELLSKGQRSFQKLIVGNH